MFLFTICTRSIPFSDLPCFHPEYNELSISQTTEICTPFQESSSPFKNVQVLESTKSKAEFKVVDLSSKLVTFQLAFSFRTQPHFQQKMSIIPDLRVLFMLFFTRLHTTQHSKLLFSF